MTRPNILWICTDQQRFDTLGCYGNRFVQTPNIHRLDREGAEFDHRIDHSGAHGHAMGAGKYALDRMSDSDHRWIRAAYWGMCDLIDANVGSLLAVLEESGQAENPIVIYTSDHGEMLGDHGVYLKAPYCYDPAIRVPLIVRYSGAIRPRRIPALVEAVDIPQTLLDAIGVPHDPGMQGQSLWPVLCGEAAGVRHRDDVHCEYYDAMPWHPDRPPQMTMVRSDRYKIVVDHGGGGELYDLEDDPLELASRWSDPGLVAAKATMLERLCNRMASTVDPLPERRAEW